MLQASGATATQKEVASSHRVIQPKLIIMKRSKFGKATQIVKKATTPVGLWNSKSTTRPKTKPVVLSEDPLFRDSPFFKTLQTMETKPQVELTGVVGRVFNNKDVELLLFNTEYQSAQAPNDAATDQLMTAGMDLEFLQAVADDLQPAGFYTPLKLMGDGTWIVKVKATIPEDLKSIRDSEAEYGYQTQVMVRAVAVPRLWRMEKMNTCGFVLDLVNLELVSEIPPLV